MSRLAAPLALFAMFLLCSFPVSAGPISPFTLVDVGDGFDSLGNPLDDHSGIGPLTLNVSHSLGGGTLTATAFAQAGYNLLKASTSATLTNTVSPVTAVSTALAAFRDTMTINYAPFTGQLGLMQVNYSLDLTSSHSGSFNSTTLVEGYVCTDCGNNDPSMVDQQVWWQSSASGIFTFPNFFKFTYGTPFSFQLHLQPATGTFDIVGGQVVRRTTTQTGSGSVDASDTLSVSTVAVFDSLGNPVTGYSASTGSGTTYGFDGAVPEPSTWLLIGAALFPIIALSKKPVRLRITLPGGKL